MPFSNDIHPMIVTGFDTGLVMVRAAEHLLGAVIGAFSIFLGYRLFLHVPRQTNSAGKIVLPGGINIWLSRVGPGVFFSLFGTALVALSLSQRLGIETKQTTDFSEPGKSANSLIRIAEAAPVSKDAAKTSAVSRNSHGAYRPPVIGQPQTHPLAQKNTSGDLVATRETSETKVSYSNSTLAENRVDKLGYLRVEARKAITELDDVPNLLTDKVDGARQVSLALAVHNSKLAIVQSVWGKDWGDFETFRNWVRNGETPAEPQGISPEAIKLFRATREGR